MSQPTFFTPGPAQLYPTVSSHLQRAMQLSIPSISHRSNTYHEFHANVFKQLQIMFAVPDDYLLLFAGSATQLMERTIQNTVGSSSFHHVNGSFSRRFFEISRDLGKNAQAVSAPLGSGFNWENIEIEAETELITFTAVETSTGVQIPKNAIKNARKKCPKAIIALDVVSTFPLFDFDINDVDVLIFGVQKALGLPAGLGVALISPKAVERAVHLRKQGIIIGSFGAWPLIAEKAKNFQTLETPNVLAIYLLSCVLTDLNAVGLTHIRAEAAHKLDAINNTISKHPQLNWYVKNPTDRATSLVVIECKKPEAVLQYMQARGWILGGGYGEDKNQQFRIANFPAIEFVKTTEMLDDLAKMRI